jgi:iron-sulfur cluster assembly protein
MNDILVEEKIENVCIPTGVIGADENEDFAFTPNALKEIQKIIAENNITDNYYLRINTKSAGCLGMSFNLGFDGEIHDNDRLFKLNTLNIAVDSKSLFYLMGVKIDFISSDKGKGFIFEQPNDFKTCGCHS